MNEPVNGMGVLWTVKEAADRLKTSVPAIYKMVERRQIPHLRLGTRIRFDPTILAQWLVENSVPARLHEDRLLSHQPSTEGP